MPYQLKYTCDFDRIDSGTSVSYQLQILQKDYPGAVTAVTGSASPVVHTWETDDPKAPVKGSSLAISLINEGLIPLSDFYSESDDEFKAILLWGTTELFHGFILQDDSSEPMVDFNHEITLSATDNLGLLKDVAFDQVPLLNYSTTTESYRVYISGMNTILETGATFGNKVHLGDTILIGGAGPYTVRFLSFDSGTNLWSIYLAEYATVTGGIVSGVLKLYQVPVLDKLITLLETVRRCIAATGLTINTRIFSNINESTQSGAVCFLAQTLIDPETFYNGTGYDDCYTVLEKILTRFNFTLFQSYGFWNIVRWDEARYYDYAVPGYEYDMNFALVGPAALDWSGAIFGGFAKLLIGIGETTVAETGLQQRITRPFKFVKEIFNYRQPAELLRNYDLQQLGDLITTYTTGSGAGLQTISEFAVPWWYYTNAFPSAAGVNGPAVYFIRVIVDNVGNELSRVLVVKNNDIHSYPIEAQTGDIIRFSFSVYQSSAFTSVGLIMKLTNGTTTVYAQQKPASPGWDTTTGSANLVAITPNEWSSVDFETGPVPFDGLLTIYVRTLSTPASNENLYRDIRVEYIPMINESSKVIGHTHTSDQNTNTKNTEEHEIYLDSSPRNSIAGALFLNSLTGLLQTRTGQWKRSYLAGAKNLGEITTHENLFLRRTPRTLLEGTFYGLTTPADYHINLLNVLRYTFFSDKTFIFGRLEIDYRNNHASGTLYELYRDSEVDADLASAYVFKYIYSPK